MVLIAGTFKIQLEDRDGAIAAMQWMMAETAKEEGCVSYDMSTDLTDPTIFHLFEEWESEEHLQAHFVVPHMAVFRDKLAELGQIERNISHYVATDKAPLG
jgi:quinol monooxygenase YgiN